MKQEMMGWQWHQLDHMQIICILLSFAYRSRQVTTPVPHHLGFTFQMPFLPPNQQHQSTEGVVNNTAENSSDNFPSYPPDNHHCSDIVYWINRYHAIDVAHSAVGHSQSLDPLSGTCFQTNSETPTALSLHSNSH